MLTYETIGFRKEDIVSVEIIKPMDTGIVESLEKVHTAIVVQRVVRYVSVVLVATDQIRRVGRCVEPRHTNHRRLAKPMVHRKQTRSAGKIVQHQIELVITRIVHDRLISLRSKNADAHGDRIFVEYLHAFHYARLCHLVKIDRRRTLVDSVVRLLQVDVRNVRLRLTLYVR
uniref:Uncharacterized protein n=1 Tax=Anopheles christyi TaxID=43041 RepID=A0A182KIT8_9DIPT